LAILDLFSSVVSRPAGRILEGSVRTLVNDLIRDHDLASAAEVDSLRRSLRELEGRADELQEKLGGAEGEVAELREALTKAHQQLDESRQALDTPKASLTALEGAAHSHSDAPAAAPPPPADAEGCQVPGCPNKHRSKGFCSPHYQRWRRGTLPGYVLTDGSVEFDGKKRKLGKKHAGRPFEIVDGKPVVQE
jgi:TolA-binding protein